MNRNTKRNREEYLHIWRNSLNQALRFGAAKEGTLDLVENEVEGWCLHLRISDDEVSEEYLFAFGDDGWPQCRHSGAHIFSVLTSFKDRNGWHDPDADLSPKERLAKMERNMGKFRETLGKLVPAYEEERLKWD